MLSVVLGRRCFLLAPFFHDLEGIPNVLLLFFLYLFFNIFYCVVPVFALRFFMSFCLGCAVFCVFWNLLFLCGVFRRVVSAFFHASVVVLLFFFVLFMDARASVYG